MLDLVEDVPGNLQTLPQVLIVGGKVDAANVRKIFKAQAACSQLVAGRKTIRAAFFDDA